jgi:CRISPR/Cas system-associated exonuclease Cas4 (RecB family)
MSNLILEEAFYAFLAPNEIAHLKYALGKLGFKNEVITNNFLEGLYKHVYQKYQNKKKTSVNKRGWETYSAYDERDFALFTYRIIKGEAIFKKPRFLYDESVFKIISDYAVTETNLSYVSATDISSFVFCPVSYCIKKSFNEDEPNEEAIIGTELHEENRLVGYVAGSKNKFEFTGSVTESKFYNSQNKDFFDDLRNSNINYVGHNNTTKKYFKSSKGKFVGQPDYVFTNRNGENFIVEEKYRNLKKELRSLRDNHKAQLASYIIGLDELKANYGYLVYWYYSYEDNKRYVKKCVAFRIDKSESDQQIIRYAYKNIVNLNAGHNYSFNNSELDANKCANCIVRKFCGHKTGRLNKVSIPYSKEYYGLI